MHRTLSASGFLLTCHCCRASLTLQIKSLSTLLSIPRQSGNISPKPQHSGSLKKPASPNSTRSISSSSSSSCGVQLLTLPLGKLGLPGSPNYRQVFIFKKKGGGSCVTKTGGEAKPGKAASPRRAEGSEDFPGPRSLALNPSLASLV